MAKTKLQEIREARGLSIYKLAQLTGISRSYLGWIESGRRSMDDMTLKKIKKLAQVLEVKFTDLID